MRLTKDDRVVLAEIVHRQINVLENQLTNAAEAKDVKEIVRISRDIGSHETLLSKLADTKAA